MGEKRDNIYIYLWEEFNTIYIGRTVNPKGRHWAHKHRETEPTYRFSSEHHIEHPKMVIIENDLTIEEGVEREKYWISYYRNNSPYNVLNKSRGGQIGGNKPKPLYTKEELKQHRKEYYENNKDKILKSQKAYFNAHKEETKERREKYTKEYNDSHKKEHKEYREKNKDRIKEYKKSYRENNKEKINESIKKWRETHKKEIDEYNKTHREEILARKKAYRESHKEQIKAYREAHKEDAKKWREAHKDELKEYFKKRYIKQKLTK